MDGTPENPVTRVLVMASIMVCGQANRLSMTSFPPTAICVSNKAIKTEVVNNTETDVPMVHTKPTVLKGRVWLAVVLEMEVWSVRGLPKRLAEIRGVIRKMSSENGLACS